MTPPGGGCRKCFGIPRFFVPRFPSNVRVLLLPYEKAKGETLRAPPFLSFSSAAKPGRTRLCSPRCPAAAKHPAAAALPPGSCERQPCRCFAPPFSVLLGPASLSRGTSLSRCAEISGHALSNLRCPCGQRIALGQYAEDGRGYVSIHAALAGGGRQIQLARVVFDGVSTHAAFRGGDTPVFSTQAFRRVWKIRTLRVSARKGIQPFLSSFSPPTGQTSSALSVYSTPSRWSSS